MRLVTFQSLIDKGYLECDKSYINIQKYEIVYDWVKKKMEERKLIKNKYPIWCWVKYNNFNCPPKHKGKKIKGFDVKITFKKNKSDIFITDYIKYSFLLKYNYIPLTLGEKENFEKILKEKNITEQNLINYVKRKEDDFDCSDKNFIEVLKVIENSFERCICEDGNILQACVSRINLNEIEKVEFLFDNNIIHGSINYIHSDGNRINWQKKYYMNLK